MLCFLLTGDGWQCFLVGQSSEHPRPVRFAMGDKGAIGRSKGLASTETQPGRRTGSGALAS